MNQNNMEVLLSYKFGNKYLVELKRLDAPEGTPKLKKLSFVLVDYDTDKISKLNFVSMKEEKGVITREFKEGTLIVASNSVEMTFENEKYTASL